MDNVSGMVTCRSCGVSKSVGEYHKDISKKVGRASICKSCASAKAHRLYLSKRDDYKARAQKWREENPERYQYLHNLRNKKPKDAQKIKARNAVNNAISDGRFRPVGENTCVYCGGRAEQYHHSNGYSDDHLLDVIAVCLKCHVRVHEYRLEQENGGW